MALCITFLFQGEKILRSIFNLKSKANSMGDLAASGMLMLNFAKNAKGLLKRNKGDCGSEDDKKDVDNANKRNQIRRNKAKEDTNAAIMALDEGSNVSHGEYTGEENEPEGVQNQRFDGERARDAILGRAMRRRLTAGALTRGVNFASGAIGATMLATRTMAQGKTDPASIIAGIEGGKALGRTLGAPLAFATNKLEQLNQGLAMSQAIGNKEYDAAMGLDLLKGNEGEGGVDAEHYAGKADSQQEIYRKALQRAAFRSAIGGKSAGEIAYYNYIEKNAKADE